MPPESDSQPNDRPKDILKTAVPSLAVAVESFKQHDDPQSGDSINLAEAEANALVAQSGDRPAVVMTIGDVAVEPFVAKQNPYVPVSPAFIDEAHRQFSNPISYLGGPLLMPRNRHSIESVLSLD